MDGRLLHALDLAILRDWPGAKAVLEPLGDPVASRLFSLVSELDDREERRRKTDTHLRHDIGNALSIVRANLEGIIDGVLPSTPQRLKGMSDALSAASLLLDDLRKVPEPESVRGSGIEKIDVFTLVSTQCAMVAELAGSKSVSIENRCAGTFVGDAERCANLVRNVLIGSIRFAPPFAAIRLHTVDAIADVGVTISGLGDRVAIPRALLRGSGIGEIAAGDGKLSFLIRLAAGRPGL
jgi:hypothetical protein